MSEYKEYVYKRPKQKIDSRYRFSKTVKNSGGKFKIIFAILLVGILFFSTNLVLGFVSLSGSNSNNKPGDVIVFEGFSIWATSAGEFGDKNDSLRFAREVREQGGAGFVVSLEGNSIWNVLYSVHLAEDCAKEVDTEVIKIEIPKLSMPVRTEDDGKYIMSVIAFAMENFKDLHNKSHKLRDGEINSHEIIGWALEKYNEFQNLVNLLSKKHNEEANCVECSRTLHFVNQNLIALYLLSLQRDNENVDSHVKHSLCLIAFAYIELVNSFV